jgi:hypothetical protein
VRSSTAISLLRLCAILIVALLLGGCRLSLDVAIDLERDGGGSIAVAVGIDDELAAAATSAGVDPLQRMADRIRAADDGWRVREVDGEGDRIRLVELTSSFADPDDFGVRWASLVEALDAPEARLLGPMAVVVDDEAGTVAVEGEVRLEVTEVAAADSGIALDVLSEQVGRAVSSTLAVQTPGTPLSTDGQISREDADAVDGPATVTWVARSGEVVPVSLTAEQGGGTSPLLVALGGAVALLLVAGGVWAQRRG